jgi:coenzyme F420-reducing hydrogenase beta subunit
MIKITDERKCCGCAVCVQVCPVKCICMEERTLGAVFPTVDDSKCIGCGACDRVCPIQNREYLVANNRQHAYAAFAKDSTARYKGSSGGVFGVLAKKVISYGGIVYGAAFDSGLKLRCTSAGTYEKLEALYKSKYLQSDMSSASKEIETRLKQGRKILFVSAPC